MPPQQCPECGRFLKKDLVASLTEEPTPCPRCESPLTAGTFGLAVDASAPPAPERPEEPRELEQEAVAERAVAEEDLAAESSVRPPDLRPDEVRDAEGSVLAGWDRGGLPTGGGDRAPFPTDAAVLAGAGLAGAVLGALFGERGCRGAVLGAAGGVLGAAAARRVWRLE